MRPFSDSLEMDNRNSFAEKSHNDYNKPVDKLSFDTKSAVEKSIDYDQPLDTVKKDVVKSNSSFSDISGDIHYLDDNCNEYRINNELLPNNSYEINGYKYQSDDQGRIVSAEGKLQLKNHEGYKTIPQSTTLSEIGKGDEKATDDRAHPIGDRFNGKGDIGNLVPQDRTLNRGEYNKFEDSLAKEVAKGNEVYMKVEMDYPGKSYRPDSFIVSYSINGEEFVKVFSNDPRGELK